MAKSRYFHKNYSSHSIDTGRRFNVYYTYIRSRQCRIDVKTTSGVYWERCLTGFEIRLWIYMAWFKKSHSTFNVRSLFKVKNKDTRTMTMTSTWSRSGVFIVLFEQISHIVLVFISLNLNKCRLSDQMKSFL